MKIKGIKTLELEERPDGRYDIFVDYTEEFEETLKSVLDKKRITKKDVTKFILESLGLE
jgi:hypothetical protein